MDNAAVTPADRVTRLIMPLPAATGSTGAPRSGSEVRLGDHFDRIHAEIVKLARPSGAEEIDWKLVTTRAELLLVDESKDLQVAAWLALAWYRQDGTAGLQRGFDLLAGLLAWRWDELFPPVDKLAARAEVLSWLAERLRSDLVAVLQRTRADDVREVWRAFLRLRDLTRSRFPERGPALGHIEHAFAALPAELAAVLSEPTTSSDPATSAAANPASADVAPNAGAAAVADTGTAPVHPLLAPIAGADPTGADPWLCDEFEGLRAEIAKLGAVTGEPPAWPKVITLAQKILTERAKDLRCITYWLLARTHQDGAAGLVDGFALLQHAAGLGEQLHPRRAKARAGAFTWLGERLQAELVRQPPAITADELAAVRASIVACKAAFDPLCDGTSGLTIADEALSRLKTKPSAKPAVARAPTPTAAPKPATPMSAPAGAVAATEGLDDLARTLLDEATRRSAAGHADGSALRLRRLALWMVPPAAGAAKKLDCEVGTAAQRGELAALAASESWSELLHNCELLVLQFPWWIDLTYFSAMAAEHVIDKDAARALRAELCALALRHPTLMSSFDRKGQWLASKDVRDWFARELTPRPPELATASAAAAEPAPTPAAPPPVAATAAAPAEVGASTGQQETTLPTEIVDALRGKKFDDAMTRASTWIAAAGSGRDRFARNLALAQACLSSSEPKLALPMFRALEGQLRKWTVEQWDPSLVAGCLRGYLACKQGLGLGLGPDERLLDELVLLDPRAMTGWTR
ncbi:MAG: type VI secretion system ImpA family N-terminal domain-containing protein [Deltaproteobacteria bacterium]|nr:type VI secretion system ImpA family N-terminal domain-containing protein [Deltaproteobacteria bacterium]MBK8720065.1 type VI secretion system ImpA family N-terminal domain-containing protein [Deltaproteobacteria bacterium]MBP7289383.1 type VI secretion system ImpA family N-terminal domain-containing protein [Nannocystaceae bacterium]